MHDDCNADLDRLEHALLRDGTAAVVVADAFEAAAQRIRAGMERDRLARRK